MPRLLSVGKRIVLLSLITILLTGALVGLSATAPMYYSIRSHIEQVNLTNAAAQAGAIENHFARYHSLAAQFTSRTEIRKRLETYLAGQLSLAQLQEFSQPRLAEPASHIPDLRAMVRITPAQEIVAAVGELAEQVQQLDLSAVSQQVVSLSEPAVDLIRVSAEIHSPDGVLVGLDILYFDAQSLAPLLSKFSTYTETAQLNLISQNSLLSLGYDPVQQRVVRQELTPVLKRDLAGLNYTKTQLFDFVDGQDFTLIYVPLTEMDCGLLIRIPQRIFYQAAYQDVLWAYLSIFIMLVIGALISHYAVRPLINKLTRQAAEIEHHAIELRLAASVFEQTQQAILITDPQLNIVRTNQGAKKILHTGDTSFCERNLKEFLPPDICDNNQLLTQDLNTLLDSKGSWQGEICYKKSGVDEGDITATLQNITSVKNANAQISYLIHIFSDITERKAVHNKIIHLAHHDALTGLPNRNALMNRLSYCVDHTDSFAVLFIDLDKFKPVNDNYGHQVGDRLLSEVAQRIRSVVRANDIVGRLGGDEFLMVVESAQDVSQINVIAAKIIQQVIQPFQIQGHSLTVGVSIGIAHYPKDGDNADRIIQAADAAMYKAKQGGGNRFAYC